MENTAEIAARDHSELDCFPHTLWSPPAATGSQTICASAAVRQDLMHEVRPQLSYALCRNESSKRKRETLGAPSRSLVHEYRHTSLTHERSVLAPHQEVEATRKLLQLQNMRMASPARSRLVSQLPVPFYAYLGARARTATTYSESDACGNTDETYLDACTNTDITSYERLLLY
eukprot:2906825-Rhodomonas_salina.10